MKCHVCGAPMKKEHRFCSRCGARKKERKGRGLIVALVILFTTLLAMWFFVMPKPVLEKTKVKREANKIVEYLECGDMLAAQELIFSADSALLVNDSQVNGNQFTGQGYISSILKWSEVTLLEINTQDNFIIYQVSAVDLSNLLQDYLNYGNSGNLGDFISEYVSGNSTRLTSQVNVQYHVYPENILILYNTEEFINAVTGGLFDSYQEIYVQAIATALEELEVQDEN